MKTVNVLTRKMGDFNVFQRTSDGYFDANELLRQWNAVEGNPERNLKRFLFPEHGKFTECSTPKVLTVSIERLLFEKQPYLKTKEDKHALF